MTNRQRIKLRMYLAIRNFTGKYEAILKTVPKFAESLTDLLGLIPEIQKTAGTQETDKTGVTIGKNKLKQNLIDLTIRNSRKIAALAMFTGNDTLHNEVKYNESDLLRLPEVALLNLCQTIYDRCNENLNQLSAHGITAETQKSFFDALEAFNNALALPRMSAGERKQATEKLLLLYSKADRAIELMDYALGIVKDDQPELYVEYNANRRLVDSGGSNISLKAKAFDTSDGHALSGVTFTLQLKGNDRNNAGVKSKIVRKTASKGSLHLSNLPSGDWDVTAAKSGYKEYQTTVSISENERSDLSVGMERQ